MRSRAELLMLTVVDDKLQSVPDRASSKGSSKIQQAPKLTIKGRLDRGTTAKIAKSRRLRSRSVVCYLPKNDRTDGSETQLAMSRTRVSGRSGMA